MGLNLGKWLKGATRIRFDDRTLGNLTKNAAVAGGTLVGGPLGLAIGGAGSALGQAALPGSNIGDIVGAGVKGAGTTGLTQAGKGLVGKAISRGVPGIAGGAPGVENVASNALPSAATDVVSNGGLALPSVPNLATSAVKSSPSFMARALDAGKGAAEWAGKHDQTSAALLGGVGDALDTSDSRLRSAQAQTLERQNNESAYEFEQRKARDLAMEPLRQALMGNIFSGLGDTSSIAKNPYSGGA